MRATTNADSVDTAQPLSLTQLWEQLKDLRGTALLICANTVQLRFLRDGLKTLSANSNKIQCFPDREILAYDTISTPPALIAERLKTLYRCCHGDTVLLSTVGSASHRLPPRQWLLENTFVVRRGEQRSLIGLADLLSQSGYQRVALVREANEYALRGSVLDVFLPEHDLPLRLDFFDDEIEQLRYFDPQTQIGAPGSIEEVTLLPAYEYPQTNEAREYFDKQWQRRFGGARHSSFYQSIMDHGYALGAEYYLPLFFEHTNTIFDYLPKASLLVQDARNIEARQRFWQTLEERTEQRSHRGEYPMLSVDELFVSDAQWRSDCDKLQQLEHILPQESTQEPAEQTRQAHIARPMASPHQKTMGASIQYLADLNAGDFVVHEDYGIGVYRGLENLEIEGVSQDYIFLEYADKDELYLPIHALSLIYQHNNYGGVEPKLHSLRNKRWHKQRQKTYQQLEDVAAQLIATQAKRQLSGSVMEAHIPKEYEQFSKSFPFAVTADQQKAIDDVLADLCAKSPMDRLVCGDVGFGKTEVAARACFIAAMNGCQSIILVPTTLLAEQHARNFSERFADFPVRIALLRGTSKTASVDRLMQDLKRGVVDILIGTHRVLSSDLQFSKLGLAIIDEEHRFGVAQKERLTRMCDSVNMLCLTATPIPRTLHMSLNTLRDLSIIGTPPENRLPIQTCVAPYSDSIIREAIQRELNRGGQVYYLHNNIDSMLRRTRHLQKLVAEATIDNVHSRMSNKALSDSMSRFYAGTTNILVCTTIIESGLDVPRANTIIIERADLLGLAQLHQLRGRVGRAEQQAYAWLLTPYDPKSLKLDARRRLAAIAESNELGSGFVLATQDMEIRGVGSVLGTEQSGQASDLGVAFYRRALSRVVSNIRKNPDARQDVVDVDPATDIRLGISALLPENWIEDISVRLNIYRRVSEADTESKLNDLQLELRDRFGRLPEEAIRFFRISTLRLKANQLSVEKIGAQPNKCWLQFSKNVSVGPDMLIALMDDKDLVARVEVSGERRINFQCNLPDAEQRLEFVEKAVKALTRSIKQHKQAGDN